MRGMEAASRSAGPRITAPARVVASRPRYFGLARKAIWSGPAESSVATPERRVPASPTASPPSRATISRRVSARAATASPVRERLDDFLGDVDARAGEHGLLDDEVELLLLGDLVDDPRGALLDPRELLVPAQVQVLADLALQALEVAADVGELALLLAARRLRHRDVLLLQLGLQVAALLLDAAELGVARRELALEHLLRALGGRGLAEHALGVHEADLHLRVGGRCASQQERRQEESLHGSHPLTLLAQKILPNWNWKR